MAYLLAFWEMVLVLPRVYGSGGDTKVQSDLLQRHIGMKVLTDQRSNTAQKGFERYLAHTARIVTHKQLYLRQLPQQFFS